VYQLISAINGVSIRKYLGDAIDYQCLKTAVVANIGWPAIATSAMAALLRSCGLSSAIIHLQLHPIFGGGSAAAKKAHQCREISWLADVTLLSADSEALLSIGPQSAEILRPKLEAEEMTG